MIGQNIGLSYLVPLALEYLEKDPLAEGDFYPGDLLASVLRADARFWRDHPHLRQAVGVIVRRATPLPDDLAKVLETFQQSQNVG